jgi:histidyl-tRNA synthetase
MQRESSVPPQTVPRIRGMQDVSHESWRIKRDLQDSLLELMAGFGYLQLETPILEPTELFLRKSGGELASRIYSFTDPGSNSVSLRPEFTSSIMRHYVEHAAEIDLPARWQYAGPVFRHEVSNPQVSGQFTQIGAELVGSSSVIADVEVLGLAAMVLSKLKVADWRLELTDLAVLNSVLDAVGVSERARSFIISSVPQLSEGHHTVPRVLTEASQLHLTGHNWEDQYLSQAIEGLDEVRAKVVLRGLLHWGAADQLGQRKPDEVVDRLLRKLRGSDSEDNLRRGLELASDLAAVRGEPEAALKAVGNLVREAGADSGAFHRLSELLELLTSDPEIAGHLVLDFGLFRGLAYYNGIVFELKHPASTDALGGGGRYDALAQSLGSLEHVPALGFAYNLEALLSVSGSAAEVSNPPLQHPAALVLAADTESYRHAVIASKELRGKGLLTELEVGNLGLEQALAYARKKEMTQVVVVHHNGRRTTHAV